uniref:Uncharacterized protein n=1 Tax=Rhizophora mucronata TaxID=61149 RepID=A0A2P2MQU9_RHIMU
MNEEWLSLAPQRILEPSDLII